MKNPSGVSSFILAKLSESEDLISRLNFYEVQTQLPLGSPEDWERWMYKAVDREDYEWAAYLKSCIDYIKSKKK